MQKPLARFGVIGSGSWATALVKILTDGGMRTAWCVRDETEMRYIQSRGQNRKYLRSVRLDVSLLDVHVEPVEVVRRSDLVVVAVPSAYAAEVLSSIPPGETAGKRVLSAVKGILPRQNLLLNDHLAAEWGLPLKDYLTVMGPCHAEEVASEKLSYLTFSCIDGDLAASVATRFSTPYINTVTNTDVYGVQYAAVLKNIYALCAGIAHGLEYGDNFLSVLIANCADEMAGFLKKAGIRNMDVGVHEALSDIRHRKSPNYASSVYLGDLLVTCYSPFSRNRTFGTMIGKGYSVQSAALELDMVAEGHMASRCMHLVNRGKGADMPIAETVYEILWEGLSPLEGMGRIEQGLI
jgi:glycerol-3-phosphate dehydrogenase (NAD(P)+)